MKDIFCKLQYNLLAIKKAVNLSTGKEIALKHDLKNVYSYMLNEYNVNNSAGRKYFESYDRIRCNLCIKSTRMKSIVKDLRELGLITSNDKRTCKIKYVHDIETIKGWDFIVNPEIKAFNTEESKTQRQEEKASRIDDWENKIEEQAQAEVTQQPVVETKEAEEAKETEEVEIYINEMGNEDLDFNQDVPMSKPQQQPQPQPQQQQQPQPQQVVTTSQDHPVQNTTEQSDHLDRCRKLLGKRDGNQYLSHKSIFKKRGLDFIIKAVNDGFYTIESKTYPLCKAAACGAAHAIFEGKFYQYLQNGEIFDKIEEILA